MTHSTKKDHPYNDYENSKTRIAILEQIAKSTNDTLTEIRQDLKEYRKESWSQFRWSIGIMITLFLANTSIIISIITKMIH